MIQRDISNLHTPLMHTCGQRARLIHTRGRTYTSQLTIGTSCNQYHVECNACGMTTAPQVSVGMALGEFRNQRMLPLQRMPAMRVALDLSQTVAP